MTHRPLAGAMALALFSAQPAGASPVLPERLDATAPSPPDPARRWTAADIIEVTRITSTAISDDGRRIAFIVKQPSLAAGADRYGLYLLDRDAGPARLVLESSYLADLQRRPNGATWTLLAELGAGVQLYEVNAKGIPRLLVEGEPAQVGGTESLLPSGADAPRRAGVLAYGWSPSGDALWHSRLRPRPAQALEAWADQGLVYDEAAHTPTDFHAGPAAEALELRIWRDGSDRLVAELPGDRRRAPVALGPGAVRWAGEQVLVFQVIGSDASGRPQVQVWRADAGGGPAREDTSARRFGLLAGAATDRGVLGVELGKTGQKRLIERGLDGAILADHGEVSYSVIGGYFGAWAAPDGQAIFGVRQPDRTGLVQFPQTSTSERLETIPDHLTSCAFTPDLAEGVCSRESLARAPELVAIRTSDARLTVLARPNARYDAIPPLRTEPRTWTNRFGGRDTGYVTYPRDWRAGDPRPAIVITHGSDARNQFAFDGLQWAFPLQLFAERGYVVLSVNESPKDAEAAEAYGSGATHIPPARMQRAMGLEAVATLDAAVKAEVDAGLVDPRDVGVAGYSRGGIVATLALSQSKTFAAGINADTSFFSSGGYWRGGLVRELYRGLFGGSPLDERFAPNYRAFSPAARADAFSGPLLQIFTGEAAATGLELDQALKAANIPTELIVLPGETHMLHRPRAIRAMMARSLDWFDLWLRDRTSEAGGVAAAKPGRF